MNGAYYNEIDPYAAMQLRNLIAAGHIAPGDVDERSIEDIKPYELRGYRQCHFFAGVGVWSHALRMAGWDDERLVWTGSCPCQPFSAAGKGEGFADERHLWPAWHYLIQECRPAVIFGEQVAGKAVGPWIDLVHTDLEALGYAVGPLAFPAASVGAPHIRLRTYWVADASSERLPIRQRAAIRAEGRRGEGGTAEQSGGASAVGLADLHGDGCEPRGEGFAPVGYGPTVESNRGTGGMADTQQHDSRRETEPADHGQSKINGSPDRAGGCGGASSGLADADGQPSGQGCTVDGWRHTRGDAQPRAGHGGGGVFDGRQPGPTNGFWRAADWLLCRDGKWRPVEPGTFPLAHGAPARVGRLRAYGNAINAAQATEFIKVTM